MTWPAGYVHRCVRVEPAAGNAPIASPTLCPFTVFAFTTSQFRDNFRIQVEPTRLFAVLEFLEDDGEEYL